MEQVAEYMAKHFQGKTIAISSGYCPDCLKKGTTDVEKVPAATAACIKFWEAFFDSKRLDPFIVLNSFIPAVYANNPSAPEGRPEVVSRAYFSKTLLDLSRPGVKCPDGAHCDPTCIFCNCLVDKALGKYYVTKSDPPFIVHQGCLSQCTYTQPGTGKKKCKAMVPNVPRYFENFQCGMCHTHAQHMRTPQQTMVLIRPQSRRFEPPPPAAMQGQTATHVPSQVPIPAQAPRPKPPTPAQTKLTRLGENKYSHDIRRMLKTPPTATSVGSAKAQAPGSYTRPEVVFTPHAARSGSSGRPKRKRLDDSP
jgi:hypothetical protein